MTVLLFLLFFYISCSGTKATDDSEISESHAESGKFLLKSHKPDKPASDFSYDCTEDAGGVKAEPGFCTLHNNLYNTHRI